MATKYSIKRGDNVQVISGKDRDKQGKVLRILPKEGRVVVENVACVKKAQRPTQQNQQGGLVSVEAPISISNVMVICPKCNKPTRVSHKQDGKNAVRICKKCGAEF